jgi:hypothetical protein
LLRVGGDAVQEKGVVGIEGQAGLGKQGRRTALIRLEGEDMPVIDKDDRLGRNRLAGKDGHGKEQCQPEADSHG